MFAVREDIPSLFIGNECHCPTYIPNTPLTQIEAFMHTKDTALGRPPYIRLVQTYMQCMTERTGRGVSNFQLIVINTRVIVVS